MKKADNLKANTKQKLLRQNVSTYIEKKKKHQQERKS